MKSSESRMTRKMAVLFVKRQIADWENVLEVLDNIESLEKTVAIQEQQIKELNNTIENYDVDIMSSSNTGSVFGVSPAINIGLRNNFVLGSNTNMLPVRSAPKVFDSIDDIDDAFDKFENKLVGSQ